MTKYNNRQLQRLEARIEKLEKNLLAKASEDSDFDPCMLSSQLGACDRKVVTEKPDHSLEALHGLLYAKGLQIRDLRKEIKDLEARVSANSNSFDFDEGVEVD